MAKTKEVGLCRPEAHGLAASQARVHAAVARSIDAEISKRNQAKLDLAEVLALLVNASFSIELFFKAFMLGSNGGNFTRGHKLSLLLKDIPEKLGEILNAKYLAYLRDSKVQVHLVAYRLGEDVEEDPVAPEFSIATFPDVIACLSEIFVKARYYFEQQSTDNWSVVVFPQGPLLFVLEALETTYSETLAGRTEISYE